MSEFIVTYLQDHHAGSSAGVQAFERVAQWHGDPAVRDRLQTIAAEVEEDQASLEQIMSAVGASASRVKDAAGWVGEKLARLKPNQRLATRSALSDVLELEALVMAVHGKGLLWQALLTLGDPRLDRDELERLRERATRQQEQLEGLRLDEVHKLSRH